MESDVVRTVEEENLFTVAFPDIVQLFHKETAEAKDNKLKSTSLSVPSILSTLVLKIIGIYLYIINLFIFKCPGENNSTSCNVQKALFAPVWAFFPPSVVHVDGYLNLNPTENVWWWFECFFH